MKRTALRPRHKAATANTRRNPKIRTGVRAGWLNFHKMTWTAEDGTEHVVSWAENA